MIVKVSQILAVNMAGHLRRSHASQSSLRRCRCFDMHVLRMTAIASAAQLLHLLPELVCGSGLTGIISGGRRVLGDAIEGIEILPYRECRRRVDRRAVGRCAGL